MFPNQRLANNERVRQRCSWMMVHVLEVDRFVCPKLEHRSGRVGEFRQGLDSMAAPFAKTVVECFLQERLYVFVLIVDQVVKVKLVTGPAEQRNKRVRILNHRMNVMV